MAGAYPLSRLTVFLLLDFRVKFEGGMEGIGVTTVGKVKTRDL